MHQVKITPENLIEEFRLNGKLDYQVNDNLRVVGGGTFDELTNRTIINAMKTCLRRLRGHSYPA